MEFPLRIGVVNNLRAGKSQEQVTRMLGFLRSHPDVLNVETVVLPNIWSPYEEGSADVALGTSGEMPSHWHQFIRCWYED